MQKGNKYNYEGGTSPRVAQKIGTKYGKDSDIYGDVLDDNIIHRVEGIKAE
ncbi:hypothetical protein [Pedobacter sp. HMWF019]|uniref:hypothetical protein n=1 Tax=Pedobacter sp. HMWF019 TaxID=2056856 RepID=UPI0013049C68|nr:hypothetical protein [Pedobacter sp. HMWF019]